MQMLKRSSDSLYRLVELDIVRNEFNLLYNFTSEPNAWMNGAAYNPVDGIAYAQFQYGTGNPRVLCRFSHWPNSQQCFCTTGSPSLYSATITSDGHYYLSPGGNSFLKLADVANVTASSPLSPCVTSTILSSKVLVAMCEPLSPSHFGLNSCLHTRPNPVRRSEA